MDSNDLDYEDSSMNNICNCNVDGKMVIESDQEQQTINNKMIKSNPEHIPMSTLKIILC